MAGELEREFRLLNGLRHGNLPNKARESGLGSLYYYLVSLTHSLTRVLLVVLLSVIDSVVVVEFVAIGIQVDGAGGDIATAEVDVLAVGEVDIAAGVACGWRWGESAGMRWTLAGVMSTLASGSTQIHALVSPLRSSVHSALGAEGGPVHCFTKRSFG